MKTRRLVLIILLLCGFYYLTARSSPSGTFGAWLDRHMPAANQGGAAGLIGSLRGPLHLTEASAQPAFDSDEQNNIAVYKKAVPSVVNVSASSVAYDFFYGAVPQQGQGSGFILDTNGHVLTNSHVIEGARLVEVTLHDKHKYTAQVLLNDKGHDLALLQIQASGASLVPATLADSRSLVVGQKVFAIGNPFGLAGTMTRGIISSIRSVRGPVGNLIEDAIQTDAAINPGNSGGPLLNSRGEVIGINSLIATGGGVDQNAGIGFAIPVNTAKAAINDFSRYGHVRRPTLDVSLLPIGPELAQQMGLASDYGVLIERTLPGGAAERAGLHGGTQKAYLGNNTIYLGGDLIIAMDGDQVSNTQEIGQILNGHSAGDTVTVTVLRGRKKVDVPVKLGEMKEGAA
jgi:S1-C subfamily serine protease